MSTITTDTWGLEPAVGRGRFASGASIVAPSAIRLSAPKAAASWHATSLTVTAMPATYEVKQGFNAISRRPPEGSS